MTVEPTPTLFTFPPLAGEGVIVVTRVIDGDTLTFGWMIGDTARLVGINAPEITGPTREAGIASRDRLRQLILDAGPILRVRVRGRDKYGRALLELLDPASGRTINQAMLDSGHAIPYMQDRK